MTVALVVTGARGVLGGTHDEARDVNWGRAFGAVVAVATYLLAQAWGASVFNIAKLAFSGYVTLVPALFFGVRWKRFTATGAAASILLGNLVYGLGVAKLLPTFGFLPVFWALLVGIAAAVGVSLASKPSEASLTAAAFGD